MKTDMQSRIYRLFCSKCEQLSDYDYIEMVDPDAKCKSCGSKLNIDFTRDWKNEKRIEKTN